MTMTLPAAAARLGREIATAHNHVDQALVSVAALFHSAVVARTDITNIDPAMGHGALLRMHKSAGDLLAVRADILRVHGALKDDLRTVAGAEEPTCPDQFFVSAESEGIPAIAA